MRTLVFNGNEIVFADEPNKGVAGIAPDQPDSFAENICERYNFAESLRAQLSAAKEENEALRAENATLREQLASAREDAFREAAKILSECSERIREAAEKEIEG